MNWIVLLLLSSCALFKQDPDLSKKIREMNLAGKWQSEFGYFKVHCQGAFEYQEPVRWDNRVPKHSETDGQIKWIKGYKFKTGLVFGETHDINRAPYQKDNSEWWIDLNDKSWKRIQSFNCES
jgi:hypothetical protein